MTKIEFLKKLAAEVPDGAGASKPKEDKSDSKKEGKKPFPPKGESDKKSDSGKGGEKQGLPFKKAKPAGEANESSESPEHEGSESPEQESAEHTGQGEGGEQEIPGNESAEGAAVTGGAADPSAIIEFFAQNARPDDEAFHEFAEGQGFDVHAAEQIAYALAGKYVQFLRGGKSAGIDISTVDPQQLEIGMQVEAEHTDDPVTQKKIALDHLAEMPDYYTRLQQMEGDDGQGDQPAGDQGAGAQSKTENEEGSNNQRGVYKGDGQDLTPKQYQ